MLNENKEESSLKSIEDIKCEPKVTDTNSYVTSGVRQKVFNNWSHADQKPLKIFSHSDNDLSLLKPKRKRSPKKPLNANSCDVNSQEFKDRMKRWNDTIEGVANSTAQLNESVVNGVHESKTSNDLSLDPNNCLKDKLIAMNGFCNILENNIKLDSIENNIEVNTKPFNCNANPLETNINSLPNNITGNGIEKTEIYSNNINTGITTATTDKTISKKCKSDKEIKQKTKRIIKQKINDKIKNKNNKNNVKLLKINPNSLFKNSPYLSSFQNFLSKPSDKTDNTINSTSNAFLFNKYLPKKKSESQIMAQKRVKQLRGIKTTGNYIIKRNRTKPLVIKDLSSQKSFLDFLVKKFPPIKEGVPFIQDRSCKDFSKDFESSVLFCLDCNDKRSDSKTCRFYQYRTLIKNNGQLSVYAFAEEGNATQDDSRVWLPVSKPFNLDGFTAKFLLTHVGQQFCKLYAEESKIIDSYISYTWKKPVKGIRELCDVCQTTIFNTHYVCSKCGFAVCIDCYEYRKVDANAGINYRKNHDEFGWVLCHEKQKHDYNTFHLALFITKSVFGSIDSTLHKLRNEFQIKGICDCGRLDPSINLDIRQTCENIDLKHIYPHIPQQWLCDDRMLVLTDPKCSDNLTLFQLDWLKGNPVMIESVHLSLNADIWSPESFNKHFGKQTSRLVNCMDGTVLSKRPMSAFWNGFEDVNQRLVDEEKGQEMILKLKDWPPFAEFRDILPLWFDNLMEVLPLREYTRYDGSRNLASRLPEFFVRPDLGPKMYCAYGSVLHPEKGTTNLHLDMSDAINVMIYVGVAQKDNKPLESHLIRATETLIMGGCDQQMLDRANAPGRKVGALWHIWKAEEANKIREFLQKVAKERSFKREMNNDPIHDQSWYLDETLRQRLEREYGVKGLAIAQCLGDAILVPAGAPHQVQNIHSCIKVAGEFVSPENVRHCVALTHEFRKLSKRHNNHEDKLQIKNIIYHSVKDSLALLLPQTLPQQFVIPRPLPKQYFPHKPSIHPITNTPNGQYIPNCHTIPTVSTCIPTSLPMPPMDPPISPTSSIVMTVNTLVSAITPSVLTEAPMNGVMNDCIPPKSSPNSMNTFMFATPLFPAPEIMPEFLDSSFNANVALNLPPTPPHFSPPNLCMDSTLPPPPILHPYSYSEIPNCNLNAENLIYAQTPLTHPLESQTDTNNLKAVIETN